MALDSVFVRIATLSAEALTTEGTVRTSQFLAACGEVLPIIEKLGTAFSMVRSDISGNITRLQARQAQDPDRYALLFPILLDEVEKGEDKGSSSATKGLLWLKRAMEFIVALLQRLHDDQEVTLPEAASETYTATLYRYHGWITSSAFTVALKFAPSREAFFEKFELPPEADLMQQLQQSLLIFGSLLVVVDTFIKQHGLDDPTRV